MQQRKKRHQSPNDATDGYKKKNVRLPVLVAQQTNNSQGLSRTPKGSASSLEVDFSQEGVHMTQQKIKPSKGDEMTSPIITKLSPDIDQNNKTLRSGKSTRDVYYPNPSFSKSRHKARLAEVYSPTIKAQVPLQSCQQSFSSTSANTRSNKRKINTKKIKIKSSSCNKLSGEELHLLAKNLPPQQQDDIILKLKKNRSGKADLSQVISKSYNHTADHDETTPVDIELSKLICNTEVSPEKQKLNNHTNSSIQNYLPANLTVIENNSTKPQLEEAPSLNDRDSSSLSTKYSPVNKRVEDNYSDESDNGVKIIESVHALHELSEMYSAGCIDKDEYAIIRELSSKKPMKRSSVDDDDTDLELLKLDYESIALDTNDNFLQYSQHIVLLSWVDVLLQDADDIFMEKWQISLIDAPISPNQIGNTVSKNAGRHSVFKILGKRSLETNANVVVRSNNQFKHDVRNNDDRIDSSQSYGDIVELVPDVHVSCHSLHFFIIDPVFNLIDK